MLRAAAGVALRWNAVLIVSAALLLGVALLRSRRTGAGAMRDTLARCAPLAPAFAFGGLLFAAYAGVVFGHWHFARYLFPLAVPFTLTFALAVGALEATAARRGAALALLLAATALMLQPPFARLFEPVRGAWGDRAIGEWAQERFPAGTRIGASQSGALGYFANSLVVVNLDGVVNRDAHVAMRERRALDYVRESGIR
jgi:hypothetical protein